MHFYSLLLREGSGKMFSKHFQKEKMQYFGNNSVRLLKNYIIVAGRNLVIQPRTKGLIAGRNLLSIMLKAWLKIVDDLMFFVKK